MSSLYMSQGGDDTHEDIISAVFHNYSELDQ